MAKRKMGNHKVVDAVAKRRADLVILLRKYDDGTGTLGIVIDHALADDPDATVEDIASILDEAIADARIERERTD